MQPWAIRLRRRLPMISTAYILARRSRAKSMHTNGIARAWHARHHHPLFGLQRGFDGKDRQLWVR